MTIPIIDLSFLLAIILSSLFVSSYLSVGDSAVKGSSDSTSASLPSFESSHLSAIKMFSIYDFSIDYLILPSPQPSFKIPPSSTDTCPVNPDDSWPLPRATNPNNELNFISTSFS